MIYKKFEDIDTTNYPVVIFGRGPAGITLARELERKKIKTSKTCEDLLEHSTILLVHTDIPSRFALSLIFF